MATVGDLVADALTDLGYLAAPETPTAGDGALALRILNRMIGQWKAERLMIYQVTRSTWTIVSGTASYTVGPSGAVNIARPTYIRQINYSDSTPDPDAEYPLYRLTEDEYAAVQSKAQTSTLPTSWYYNPTVTTGTLYLLPIPTSSTLTGVIYHHEAVPVFSALTDTVTLPPAYERMIVKNLAKEMAPSFKKVPNPMLLMQAEESMMILKRENFRMEDLWVDSGFENADSYNIRQG